MAIDILYDPEQARACMFDRSTEQAFGPVFLPRDIGLVFNTAYEECEVFQLWLVLNEMSDPRDMSDPALRVFYERWLTVTGRVEPQQTAGD